MTPTIERDAAGREDVLNYLCERLSNHQSIDEELEHEGVLAIQSLRAQLAEEKLKVDDVCADRSEKAQENIRLREQLAESQKLVATWKGLQEGTALRLAEKEKELGAALFRVAALREGLQEADSFPDVGGAAKVSIKNALLCDDGRTTGNDYYTLKGLRSINAAYSERLTHLEQQLEAIRKQTADAMRWAEYWKDEAISANCWGC